MKRCEMMEKRSAIAAKKSIAIAEFRKKREEIKIRYAKEWSVLHKQICELAEKKRSIKSKEQEELKALLYSHWKDLECLKEEKRELLREYRK